MKRPFLATKSSARVRPAFAFPLVLVTALAAAPHAAPAATMLGTGPFGDEWFAWQDTEAGKRVCFMHATPQDMAPKGVTRGSVLLMVVHRPGDNARNVVSVVAGYTFAANSVVTVTIDRADFPMFTKDDGAWAYTADQDAAMVRAMISGSRMTVKGTSSRGTTTTDTYSLAGFTAAHDAIDRACPAGR